MGCCKIDKKKFLLTHNDNDRFHRSEWTEPGVKSMWYMIYRVVLAVLMVSGVVAHALSTKDTLGTKWLIYMTNQGISFLTLHYVFYAILVVWNFSASYGDDPANGTHLPLIYKISWGLQNMSSTVALFITLIYWTLLHPVVLEYNLIKGVWMNFLNVFLHGLNTVSYFIDIFVDARPTRIHHFYFSVIFGVYYTIFSLSYWAAGGLARCDVRCNTLTPNGTTVTTSPDPPVVVPSDRCEKGYKYPCDVVVCDDFIYPITDWTCHPGQAVLLIILSSAIGMPILQTVWWSLHLLRKKISLILGGRRFEVDRDIQNMTKGDGQYDTTAY